MSDQYARLDGVIAQRDAARRERDAAEQERDAARADRDAALRLQAEAEIRLGSALEEIINLKRSQPDLHTDLFRRAIIAAEKHDEDAARLWMDLARDARHYR